jgi:hypothetical protein
MGRNLVKKARNNYFKEQYNNAIRRAAYQTKLKEFMVMSIEELQTHFETKRPGGVYKLALIEAVRVKQAELDKPKDEEPSQEAE